MRDAELIGHDAPTYSSVPFALDQHRVMLGDLVLDLALRTIHSNSLRSVKLSGNEFVILATMTKNAGQYMSKTELLTAIGGADPAAAEGVIDTYLRYLRRRLTEADSSVTIEGGPQIGYRLCP